MQIGVLSVKDSNQFLSPPLLQSLRAMVTNSMNLRLNDDNPLWDRFSISAVPTLIAFDKGKIISRRDTKIGVGLYESDLNSLFSEII
jgi:hypothetical protein